MNLVTHSSFPTRMNKPEKGVISFKWRKLRIDYLEFKLSFELFTAFVRMILVLWNDFVRIVYSWRNNQLIE